jgi:uncharacterized membrane protein
LIPPPGPLRAAPGKLGDRPPAGPKGSLGPPRQIQARLASGDSMAAGTPPSSELPEAVTGTGSDLGRLLSLSDGIFGFSMTLLIVNLAIPTYSAAQANPADLGAYLGSLKYGLIAYVEAFLVIVSWWSTHHRLFGAIRRYDPTLIRLNNLFLLSISLTPFLLALVVSYGPPSLLSTAYSAKLSVFLFALLEMASGTTLWGIWKYVTRTPGMVDPRVTPHFVALEERQSLGRVGMFAISALVALVLPQIAIWLWLTVLFGGSRRIIPQPKAPGTPAAPATDLPPTPIPKRTGPIDEPTGR